MESHADGKPGVGQGVRRSSPTLLTDYVTDQIRARIVLGQMRPGEWVPMDLLAKELGSSRVPLREAVRQLEAESLVTSIPRRGAVVSQFDEGDVRDSFTILETVEGIAVARVAESADAEVVGAMHRWAQEIAALQDKPVSEEMLNAHRAFHFLLFDAGGGTVLLRHLRMLWYTCERYVMLCMPDPKRRAESLGEHEELCRCIGRRDRTGALDILQHHLHASLASVLQHLPESTAHWDGEAREAL
jgi:DNA-binding GntR family transcriptional regulator